MENTRKCRKCEIEKPLDSFRRMKTNRDGIALVCKKCTNKQCRDLRHAKRRAANAFIRKEKENGLKRENFHSEEEWKNHLESLKKAGVENFIKNKERKDVRKTPQWKRASSLRSSLRTLVRNLNPSKRIIEIVGKNHEELKIYLESLFKPGMSWENYGKHGWHVDHILPCASFDLTSEEAVRRCFHFSNLQPLWSKENWKKGFKID